MNDTIEVFVDHDGQTPRVGRCHYIARRHGQSSAFEYADAWHDRADAFALDPASASDLAVYATAIRSLPLRGSP